MSSLSDLTDLIELHERNDRNQKVTELECLKGSYSTLEYNKIDIILEYTDHLKYIDKSITELEKRNLPVLQYKLHNYITSSYSFIENVETGLSHFDQLLDDYKEGFYNTPIEKCMRGLRIYAQHHRVLPLKIKRVTIKNKYPTIANSNFENLVFVNINEMMSLKQDWDEKTQNYFFELNELDFINKNLDLNIIEAVETHYNVSSHLFSWIVNNLKNKL